MAGDVVAWVGTSTASSLSREAREVGRATVEHDRVIGAALAQGVTPVPVSLADPYPDDVAVSRDIAEHAHAISRALSRVRDAVEMTTIVSLTDSPPPTDAAGRGRAYLEQLHSQRSRIAAIADRIASELQALAGDPQRRADGGTVALSHLISRNAVETYHDRVISLAGQGFRILVDGPRAPYSFTRFAPRQGIRDGGPTSAA
jgi:hypothetical protein